VTFPVVPVDTDSISVRLVLVETVEVGFMTIVVPPGTAVHHGARDFMVVVVLVSGAELPSPMCAWLFVFCHRVAFKQQHVYKLNCM